MNALRSDSWIVYILQCGDGSLYTGITNDLSSRVLKHNSGKGAKYTRSRRPVLPVYAEYAQGRSGASKREAQIKKLKRSSKEELVYSGTNELKEFWFG